MKQRTTLTPSGRAKGYQIGLAARQASQKARRLEVRYLYSRGYNIREIADFLQVARSTIHHDINALRKESGVVWGELQRPTLRIQDLQRYGGNVKG